MYQLHFSKITPVDSSSFVKFRACKLSSFTPAKTSSSDVISWVCNLYCLSCHRNSVSFQSTVENFSFHSEGKRSWASSTSMKFIIMINHIMPLRVSRLFTFSMQCTTRFIWHGDQKLTCFFTELAYCICGSFPETTRVIMIRISCHEA